MLYLKESLHYPGRNGSKGPCGGCDNCHFGNECVEYSGMTILHMERLREALDGSGWEIQESECDYYHTNAVLCVILKKDGQEFRLSGDNLQKGAPDELVKMIMEER